MAALLALRPGLVAPVLAGLLVAAEPDTVGVAPAPGRPDIGRSGTVDSSAGKRS